ncbi:hypothetical protein EVAR_41136_1 [Eumeta japonica]|uniref:Uncharacterized protein n=1 Tax=Eumeta variegata TaxID=151549 RepID=A0A4C1YD08_EUMVA|nr:hypothetical protein EVAR_41136_1 [Eumeta japonica]
MMVESAPEAPHDLGMSGGMGVLPQWKRELLQRRAARTPPPPPMPPPPPAPSPPADDDEELRYGPGIVKRLKSRYLSLALRDAPRRRPSVLRRATSLEHLLDERPATQTPFQPASRPHPPPIQLSQSHPSRPMSEVFLNKYSKTPRRDFVKRARSVDALSRLDIREDPPPLQLNHAHATTVALAPKPAPTPKPTLTPTSPPALTSAPTSVYTPACTPTLASTLAPTFTPAPALTPESAPTPPTTPTPTSATTPTDPLTPTPVQSHTIILKPVPVTRATRPPRRPAPLLRDAERPPADVVRSALRKFETAPPRRAAPAARISAVLRGLGARTVPLPAPASVSSTSPVPPIRSSTPEPRGRSPSPAAADLSAIEESPKSKTAVRSVSPTALENIARAGCTIRYAFEVPKRGSHLPPVAATNPVLLGRVRNSATTRRVGVIRPMPATPSPPPIPSRRFDSTVDVNLLANSISHTKVELSQSLENGDNLPPSSLPNDVRSERKEAPPSVAVEPIPRSPPRADTPPTAAEPLLNGHADPETHKTSTETNSSMPADVVVATTVNICTVITDNKQSRISAAKIERALNNNTDVISSGGAVWGARRGRGARPPPAPSSTSVVFDFSNRKEVPDYIENDGVVRRVPRRDRLKRGTPEKSVYETILFVIALVRGQSSARNSEQKHRASNSSVTVCTAGVELECGTGIENENESAIETVKSKWG